MKCLIGYVGLQGCGLATPDSGEYLNSLPGISIKKMEGVADDRQINFLGVFNDIQNNAAPEFSNEVIAAFKERDLGGYNIKQLYETFYLTSEANTTTNQTSASAEYRGFVVKTNDGNTAGYVKSNFFYHNVQSLSLYTKAIVNDVAVKIIDADTKRVLFNHNIEATVANSWNEVPVNEKFFVKNIECVYDATGISSVETLLPSEITECYCNAICDLYGTCEASIVGMQTTSDSDFTVASEGENTFGLTGVFSIGCGFEALVCNNKSNFTLAWKYLLGKWAMLTAIFSDRESFINTTDKKEQEELRDFYQLEFIRTLKLAVAGIELNPSDCCLECENKFEYSMSV